MADICSGVEAPPKCKSIDPSLVLFVADDSDLCVSLLSTDISANDYILMNKNQPLNGFIMHKKGNSFEIDIKCNHDIVNPTFDMVNDVLLVQSQNSCGEYNETARVFANNKYLLCAIIIVIGSVLLTIGGYKWDALMGFIGFIVGFGCIFFIFWGFVGYKEEPASYIIIFVIATIVGILCAYLCRIFTFLSYLFMGFSAGFFFAKYVLTTFQFNGDEVN